MPTWWWTALARRIPTTLAPLLRSKLPAKERHGGASLHMFTQCWKGPAHRNQTSTLHNDDWEQTTIPDATNWVWLTLKHCLPDSVAQNSPYDQAPRKKSNPAMKPLRFEVGKRTTNCLQYVVVVWNSSRSEMRAPDMNTQEWNWIQKNLAAKLKAYIKQKANTLLYPEVIQTIETCYIKTCFKNQQFAQHHQEKPVGFFLQYPCNPRKTMPAFSKSLHSLGSVEYCEPVVFAMRCNAVTRFTKSKVFSFVSSLTSTRISSVLLGSRYV